MNNKFKKRGDVIILKIIIGFLILYIIVLGLYNYSTYFTKTITIKESFLTLSIICFLKQKNY